MNALTATRPAPSRTGPAPRPVAGPTTTPAAAVAPAAAEAAAEAAGDVVAGLCHQILASLARQDQRRSGELYIRGLLETTGRKSIRNIASPTGIPATAQRLHHFVSDSTWHWRPVRAALARHLGQLAPPRALVVHTATMPRPQRGGVGSDHFTDPRTGRLVTAQRAVGLWAATAWGGYPLDWHLHLTPRWLNDPHLREQAGIPADALAHHQAEAGLDLVLDTAPTLPTPPVPVLLDARHAPAGPLAAQLGAAGFPHLLRISASQPLTPLTPDGRPTGRTLTARQLAAGVPPGRVSRVSAPRSATGHREVARVPCQAADTPPGPRQRHLLLAHHHPHHPPRTDFWLTDLTTLSTPALLALTATPAHLAQDATGRQVGLYDFEGRSFAGWHRHITLASAAHAAVLLLRARGAPLPPAGRPR
ncbi:transposase [Streptomyces sp. NPDC005574]|uniref:IS701 family transposase n=1 Tax=Streptomyces sp. NPDC005574 TaxID=3156891 RepID=UPI0033A5C35A